VRGALADNMPGRLKTVVTTRPSSLDAPQERESQLSQQPLTACRKQGRIYRAVYLAILVLDVFVRTAQCPVPCPSYPAKDMLSQPSLSNL